MVKKKEIVIMIKWHPKSEENQEVASREMTIKAFPDQSLLFCGTNSITQYFKNKLVKVESRRGMQISF